MQEKGKNCSVAVNLCFKKKLELEKQGMLQQKAQAVCRKGAREHLEISWSLTSPLPGVSEHGLYTTASPKGLQGNFLYVRKKSGDIQS